GAFIDIAVPAGTAGLNLPHGMAFAGSKLYISSYNSSSVIRTSVSTGITDALVPTHGSGLDSPQGLTIGPDGNVYVSSRGTNSIMRFDASSGAPLPSQGNTGADFVPAGRGGLSLPQSSSFGPDGNFYVASYGSHT